MSVFKFNPLLVVALFGVVIAFCLLVYVSYSLYQFFKALEYEKPVDIEAQAFQTCPKVVEPVKPAATYQPNRVRKVLPLPVLRLGQFLFSSRRPPLSSSVLDESFTCIDKDIFRNSPYSHTRSNPPLCQNRTLFCQPSRRPREDDESVPSLFDLYVSSRREPPQVQVSNTICTSQKLEPAAPTRYTPRAPPDDVWWLSAKVIVKPTDSLEQKPIVTNQKGRVRRHSTSVVLGDISNLIPAAVPIVFVTPPTPKKDAKWSRNLKRISEVTTRSSPVQPVMKSLKSQGRKPPDRRPRPVVPRSLLDEANENIPKGYF